MQSIKEFGQKVANIAKSVFKNKDGKPIRKPTRRSIQNQNRGANKFGLEPMPGRAKPVGAIVMPLPTEALILDLDAQKDVERLAQHVRTNYDSVFSGPIQEQLAQIDADFDKAFGHPEPSGPPDNGYDYRRDQEVGAGLRMVKPSGSNAWPWNRKLACCGLNEKQCQCGEWRRYF